MGKWTIRALLMTLMLAFNISLYADDVEPVIIFGDSLSDNGNVTHLLQSLRKETSAAYIEAPYRNFFQRTLKEQGEKLYLPNKVIEWGQSLIALTADKILAPMVVEVLSHIQKVPLLPLPPYWHHHFTDGKVWNEYLAESMGIDTLDPSHYENHAFGGSWAVTNDKQLTFWELVKHPERMLLDIIEGKLIPPSLELVVESYLLDKGRANSNARYFLLSGGNDYINMLDFSKNHDQGHVEKYATNVVSGVMVSAQKLLHAGATKLVIFGVPDVASTPHFNQSPEKALISHAATHHNTILEDGVKQLQHQYQSAQISFINMQSLLQELIDTADRYGITETQNACVDIPLPKIKGEKPVFPKNLVLQKALLRSKQSYSQCEDSSKYVFWDEIHPTTKAHSILAERVCGMLKSSGYQGKCKS